MHSRCTTSAVTVSLGLPMRTDSCEPLHAVSLLPFVLWQKSNHTPVTGNATALLQLAGVHTP